MITRRKALQIVYDCRITSLGELAHGYTIYQATANTLINQLFDQFESQLSSNPLQLTCEGCKQYLADATYDRFSDVCKFCSRAGADYYEPKDTK